MSFKVLALFAGVGFAGCIGTDYVDDPASAIPQRIVVMPSNTAVQIGQTVQLVAKFESGGLLAGSIRWNSTDTTVVSVDVSGVAAGRRVGQGRVTALVNGNSSEPALITVVANLTQVARVVVTPSRSEKAVGETQQFVAAAYNLNNESISGAIVWNSSNPSVATIDANGLATAAGNGSTSIIATVDGIESNSAQLSVGAVSRTGMFVMRPNSGHDIRGTATLTQQAAGSLVLTFGNDFASAGGPDVHAYLSSTNALTPGSLDLGSLQHFSGAQTYAVPPSVQLNTFDWVVIHCVPFNITFGYARLQ